MKETNIHYILDGYNILKQVRYITGIRLSHGREDFIKFLDRKFSNQNMTLVFDGFPELGESIYGSSIKVKFSRQISADDLILKIVKDYKNKEKIVVVTDDRELVESLRKFKVRIKKVYEFLKGCHTRPKVSNRNINKPYIFSTRGKRITDYLYKRLIEGKES